MRILISKTRYSQ